jgi:hypothetical protein
LLGQIEQDEGHFPEARRRWEEALDLSRSVADRPGPPASRRPPSRSPSARSTSSIPCARRLRSPICALPTEPRRRWTGGSRRRS